MTHVAYEPREPPFFAGSESDFHKTLARFNQERFTPANPGIVLFEPGQALRFHQMEVGLVEALRQEAGPYLEGMPATPEGFLGWFESLKREGPGQGDRFYPWLAAEATFEQMRWFLQQDGAGEHGFDDLLALTQVRMPPRVKLEMARSFWRANGRGEMTAMRAQWLERLARAFKIRPDVSATISEALAVGNLMNAIASHRQYAFHSVGALVVSELTAPTRAAFVRGGLARLQVPAKARRFFAATARRSETSADAWMTEVIAPLVGENFARARSVAEGAVMRMILDLRCADAYRLKFGV